MSGGDEGPRQTALAQPPEPGDYQGVVVVAGEYRGVVGFYDDDEEPHIVVYPFEDTRRTKDEPYLLVKRADVRCLVDFNSHAARWKAEDIVRKPPKASY